MVLPWTVAVKVSGGGVDQLREEDQVPTGGKKGKKRWQDVFQRGPS